MCQVEVAKIEKQKRIEVDFCFKTSAICPKKFSPPPPQLLPNSVVSSGRHLTLPPPPHYLGPCKTWQMLTDQN